MASFFSNTNPIRPLSVANGVVDALLASLPRETLGKRSDILTWGLGTALAPIVGKGPVGISRTSIMDTLFEGQMVMTSSAMTVHILSTLSPAPSLEESLHKRESSS